MFSLLLLHVKLLKSQREIQSCREEPPTVRCRSQLGSLVSFVTKTTTATGSRSALFAVIRTKQLLPHQWFASAAVTEDRPDHSTLQPTACTRVSFSHMQGVICRILYLQAAGVTGGVRKGRKEEEEEEKKQSSAKKWVFGAGGSRRLSTALVPCSCKKRQRLMIT